MTLVISGVVLCYQFPNGGPTLHVRMAELFDPEMRDILGFFTAMHGQAHIAEPVRGRFYAFIRPTSHHGDQRSGAGLSDLARAS